MNIVPRDEHNRYRIYTRRGNSLRIKATSPDPEGVGVALVQLAADGDISQWDRVGVLDTRGSEEEPGEWVVNPWA